MNERPTIPMWITDGKNREYLVPNLKLITTLLENQDITAAAAATFIRGLADNVLP